MALKFSMIFNYCKYKAKQLWIKSKKQIKSTPVQSHYRKGKGFPESP
jgi:hypothetical protein